MTLIDAGTRLIPVALAMIGAPLMIGIVNRTKARLGGRQGPPLLQPYYDLRKLLGKGAVYSETTSWVFRAAPVMSLAALLAATLLVPLGNFSAAVPFTGDLLLFAYLLGMGRFMMVVAAMDTGSPFEGMGASREAYFSIFSEITLLLSLAAVAKEAIGHSILISMTEIHQHVSLHLWGHAGLILVFVALALYVVMLAENSRIPVDDPETHLELTMIHEVMVLDNSGPDMAFIQYAAALKMWLLGALIVGIVVPATHVPVLDAVISLACLAVLAVMIGVTESVMARLRMIRVPQLLVGAATLAILALVLEYGSP